LTFAGPPTPATPAVTAYAPATPSATGAGLVAIPLPFVTTSTVANPPNFALAPLPGAVHVTVTPLTGLFSASLTVACSPAPKAVFPAAVCGVPPLAVILAAGAAVFVRLKFAEAATP